MVWLWRPLNASKPETAHPSNSQSPFTTGDARLELQDQPYSASLLWHSLHTVKCGFMQPFKGKKTTHIYVKYCCGKRKHLTLEDLRCFSLRSWSGNVWHLLGVGGNCGTFKIYVSAQPDLPVIMAEAKAS